VVPRSILDKAAAEWAMLMRDPCNAKLTYPCYPSSSGGTVLIRFETDAVYNTATDTAMVQMLVPGAMRHFGNATVLTTDTLGTVLADITSTSITPGNSFVVNNASSFRPVAACAQVMFPGTELNRSGVIGLGIIDAPTLSLNMATAAGGGNINTSASSIRTICQHVERMPQSVAEVKWFPGENDAEIYSTGSNQLSASNASQGRNGILVTASGFPAGTGVRVRYVVVYEISLGSGQGQIASIAPPVSNNTPQQVVRALFQSDRQWFLESATKAGRTVGSIISYAAMGAKAIANFSAGAGLLL